MTCKVCPARWWPWSPHELCYAGHERYLCRRCGFVVDVSGAIKVLLEALP